MPTSNNIGSAETPSDTDYSTVDSDFRIAQDVDTRVDVLQENNMDAEPQRLVTNFRPNSEIPPILNYRHCLFFYRPRT